MSERNSSRHYTDEEVKTIIKTALDLQQKGTGTPQTGTGEGLTLDDIESLAEDVGIPSDYVRRAAVDMEVGGRSIRKNRFLGGIVQPVETCEVPERVTEDQLRRILIMLPSLTGDAGSGQTLGSSLSWATSPEALEKTGRGTHITVTSTRNGTLIQAHDRLEHSAGGIFGGVLGGVGGGVGIGVGLGVGIAVLGSAAFATLFPLGMIGGSYLLSRLIFSLLSRLRSKKLKEISQELRGLIQTQSE